MLLRLSALALMLATIAGLVAGAARSTAAAETLRMPFTGGLPVKIIQGYDGGTHQGVERYSLDIVLDKGSTTGAAVLAPVSGSIDWAYGPGVGNGCIAIRFADGSGLIVMLCHVILDRSFARGEPVKLGQRLGWVGGPGAVGNNGTPHIHIQLHRRNAGGRVPLPFATPEGLPIDGLSLPIKSGFNQHGGVGPIVSTNGSGTADPAPAARTPGAPTATPSAAASATPQAEAPTATSVPPTPTLTPIPAPPTATPEPPTPTPEPPTPTPASAPAEAAPPAPPEPTSPPNPVQEVALRAAPAEPAAPAAESLAAPVAPSPPAARTSFVAGTDLCLNVRSSPSRGAQPVSCLLDGSRVAIIEGPIAAEGFEWFRLGGLGWSVANYLQIEREAVPEPAAATAPPAAIEPTSERRTLVVQGAATCLNVREQPALNATALRCLPEGSPVVAVEGPVPGDEHEWYRLAEAGWVAADYLAPAAENPPAAPSAAPAAAAVEPNAVTGGRAALVQGTNLCLNVREGSSTAAPALHCLADGAAVSIVEGPVDGDGQVWYHLAGFGWAVEQYLSEAGGGVAGARSGGPAETPAVSSADAGATAIVRSSDLCLNARQQPTLGAPATACLPDGTEVTLAEGPLEADGHQWFRLAGLGWAAGDFLDVTG